MRISFTPDGWRDYQYWQAEDAGLRQRLNLIIEDCLRSPFKGLGKPEPLRQNWSGWWSRRITEEHRLVYRVTGKGDDQRLEIAKCRFHY